MVTIETVTTTIDSPTRFFNGLKVACGAFSSVVSRKAGNVPAFLIWDFD
jgi:hypothetical protein